MKEKLLENVFEAVDYKAALRYLTEERRSQFGSRFTFEKVANACGIQKTYLSRVLNGDSHLSADQLYAACDFLRAAQAELDFICLLRESQLATNPKRRTLLTKELEERKRRGLKIASMVDELNKPLKDHQTWEYYSEVDLQLVHLLLTIPKYAKEPTTIASILGISEELLQKHLLKLQSWNLVKYRLGTYELDQPVQHLSDDSPIYRTHEMAMRSRSGERIRNRRKESDYIFSVLFTADEQYQTKLKSKILKLLKEAQSEIVKAKSEKLYQLSIDFFAWS